MSRKTNKYDNVEVYNKDWFIHEIASRAHFTLSDVRIIWKTVEEIIYDIVREKSVLKIERLFRLQVKKINSYDGWDGLRGCPQRTGAYYKIILTPSSKMTNLIRSKNIPDDIKKDITNKEEQNDDS
jgi:hypothetical protein